MATWTDITSSCSGLTTQCAAETFTNKGGFLKLIITHVYQSDPVTNQTKLDWELRIGGTPWVTLYAYYAKINNTEIVPKNTTSISNWSANHLVTSGTTTFNNNDDGTITLTPYIKQLFYYGYSDARWESPSKYQEVSGSITVPRLARASTITLGSSSVALNNSTQLAVTISAQNSSFYHSIEVVDSSAGVMHTYNPSSAGSTTYSFVPDYSLASTCMSTTYSKTFTIRCKTYLTSTRSASELVGQDSKTVTFTVPQGYPNATWTVVDEMTSKPSVFASTDYIKGKSNLKFTLHLVPYRGSTFTTESYYQFNGSRKTISSTADITFNVTPSSAGSKTLTIYLKDRRGTYNTITGTVTILDYAVPTITEATVTRCLQNGQSSDSGTYVKVTFKGAISAVSNKNTKSFKIRYKAKSSSSYSDLATYTSAYTVDVNSVLGSGNFSASTSYDFSFEAGDAFTGAGDNAIKVYKGIGTGFDLMHFNSSGKAIAFGKKSEAGSDALFEVGMPANFTSTLKKNNVAVATLSDVYPIGSIYMSVNNTNPGTLFGGTWTQLKDMFLLGAGSTYSVSHATADTPTKDGGSATHYHTLNSHTHTMQNHTHTSAAHSHTLSDNGWCLININQSGYVWIGYKAASWTHDAYRNGTSNSNRVEHKADSNNIVAVLGGATDSATPGATGGPSNNTTSTPSTANTSTNNGMPPYLVVYMWKRIS